MEANGVFVQIPREAIARIQDRYFFYVWSQEESVVRWMCSFDTTEQDVRELIKERSANGWDTYHRCTKDTHPVLKYKEEVSTAVVGDTSPATVLDRTTPPDWTVVRSVPDESGGRCISSSFLKQSNEMADTTEA